MNVTRPPRSIFPQRFAATGNASRANGPQTARAPTFTRQPDGPSAPTVGTGNSPRSIDTSALRQVETDFIEGARTFINDYLREFGFRLRDGQIVPLEMLAAATGGRATAQNLAPTSGGGANTLAASNGATPAPAAGTAPISNQSNTGPSSGANTLAASNGATPAPAAGAAPISNLTNTGPSEGQSEIPASAGVTPSSQSSGLGSNRQATDPPGSGVISPPTPQASNQAVSQSNDPQIGSTSSQLKGNTMPVTTPPSGGAPAPKADLNTKTLDKSKLQSAADSAVDLYGQVQEAAISFEFATAGAKLGRDKAKSVTG